MKAVSFEWLDRIQIAWVWRSEWEISRCLFIEAYLGIK